MSFPVISWTPEGDGILLVSQNSSMANNYIWKREHFTQLGTKRVCTSAPASVLLKNYRNLSKVHRSKKWQCDDIFVVQKIIIFRQSNCYSFLLQITFSVCFCVFMSSLHKEHNDISIFSFKSVPVLLSLFHLKFIFVNAWDKYLVLFFSIWIPNCLCIIYLEAHLFPVDLECHLCFLLSFHRWGSVSGLSSVPLDFLSLPIWIPQCLNLGSF